MSYGVGHKLDSDLALLCLWHRPVAVALTGPLAWGTSICHGYGPKRKKTKKKKKKVLDVPPTGGHCPAMPPMARISTQQSHSCGLFPAWTLSISGEGTLPTHLCPQQHPAQPSERALLDDVGFSKGSGVPRRVRDQRGPLAFGLPCFPASPVRPQWLLRCTTSV